MIIKLTELLDARNRARLEFERAQAQLDAYCMAISINVRESQAAGSGRNAPDRPAKLPESVVVHLNKGAVRAQ